MKTRIAEIKSVDIADFFQTHGSLDNLQISGIGEKTKKMLETTLTKGLEKAIEERVREDYQKPWGYQQENGYEEENSDKTSVKVSGKTVVKRGEIRPTK